MTKEQIAELRDAIERLRNQALPLKPVPCEMVTRLLDEREALLEAARTAIAADGYQPLPRESYEALRAAIAKAEAE